jgi:nicotinate-nucleotide adenylyltransferase
MHVGLFFGSFNPVHIGHMALANYMLAFTDLQEVWFIVSPQNPFKEKNTLLAEQNRLLLVNLAINDHPRMRSSSIEFGLPQPSYTVNTLARLIDKFPQHKFSLILGQDNLHGFNKWKNYEEILRAHRLYIYPRKETAHSELENHPSVTITGAPLIEISSSFIRKGIKEGRDMRFFLPEKVWEEVDVMNFYRK